MNELIKQDNQAMNVASVEIESQRAIAEAQGQLTLAKKFPRDTIKAMNELTEACKYLAFAQTAFYTVPNRGSGLSIRAAEEIARIYGNIQYGHRELSRGKGKSEIEVFAWDMEKNNRSIRQITVEHVIDTKHGPRKLIDQADIDNKIANVASKQMRGRILALVPKFMVAECINQLKSTLTGSNTEPLLERCKKMISAFSLLKINQKSIEKYLGHKIDEINTEELAELIGVYNAIKEGASAEDYFKKSSEIDNTLYDNVTDYSELKKIKPKTPDERASLMKRLDELSANVVEHEQEPEVNNFDPDTGEVWE